MKRALRIAALALAGGLLAAAGYYGSAVLVARARTPRLVAEAKQASETWLKPGDLPAWQIKALLAVEDPGFYRHHGVDLSTPGAGLTTITQGLGKMLYFHPFKSGIRKIELMLLAWLALDPLVAKDEQLALFINRIYLGRAAGKPVTGFAEAAEAYYHKKIGELNEREFCSLVAMIIAPENFSLLEHPEANAERTRRIQRVISGEYRPKNLMDLFYGPLDEATQNGLAPASYFEGIYRKE